MRERDRNETGNWPELEEKQIIEIFVRKDVNGLVRSKAIYQLRDKRRQRSTGEIQIQTQGHRRRRFPDIPDKHSEHDKLVRVERMWMR